MAADPIADLLKAAPVAQDVRAAAWDAFYQSSSPDDLAAKLKTIALPQATKAALWDAKAGKTTPPPSTDLPPRTGVQGVVDSIFQPLGRAVRNNPAAAGALALGVPMSIATGGLGAPAAMALTALAGAGGAGGALATKQLATGDPTATVSGNVKEMATQGAAQAVGEGVGRGVVAGAQAGSKWLMNRAMNNMAARLSDEFPTIAQDMIDQAISVSKGGYEKAKALLQSYKAVANAAVDAADKAGATIPTTVATNAMQAVLKPIASSGDVAGNLSTLARVEQEVGAGRGAQLSISEADALKGSLFSEAKTLLKQYAQAGTKGLPQLKVEAEAKLAAARALNDAIEQATSAAGAPGYQAANSSAKDMIGVVRGLKTAMRGSQNNYQALVRPTMGALLGGSAGEMEGHPMLGATAGAMLGSPAGMSRLAILLGNPAVQAVLKQIPKPAIDAVLQGLATDPAGAGAPAR